MVENNTKDGKWVIGISGTKNSGKDTVANMISYIIDNKKNDTYLNYEAYCETKMYVRDSKILKISVADALKEVVAIMYGKHLSDLYDRECKDMKYISLKEGNEYVENPDMEKYTIITLRDLEEFPLSYYIEMYAYPIIKLRTILQYFGTDVCRNNMGVDIWVNAIRGKINQYLYHPKNACQVAIIPDIRFDNECEMIKSYNNNLVIMVDRIHNNLPKDKHKSEEFDFDPHIIINNNESEENLFDKVCKLVNDFNYFDI